MKLISKTTKQLKNKEINQICELKNTYQKFGVSENLKWFNKNIEKNDIHNLLFNNSKIIGYTLLRLRFFYVGKIKKIFIF